MHRIYLDYKLGFLGSVKMLGFTGLQVALSIGGMTRAQAWLMLSSPEKELSL